jgi:hypothetical protein
MGRSERDETLPAPSDVARLLKQATDTGNPELVKQAAELAAKQGHAALAAAISKRYNGLLVERSTYTYKSPFPKIADAKWTRFVNCMKAASPYLVTPTFNFGLFAFAVRRLCDLKVMRNPKQIDFKGKRVWSADWVEPWTLKRFLADTASQYRLFVASNVDYGSRIVLTKALRQALGSVIDGQRVTLSGLLAVCHKAGFAGAQSWVKSAKDRIKFAATTAAFGKCNGIF